MLKYEAFCMTGKVRRNNEDNYYVNGKYLPMNHGDSPLICGQVCEEPAVFAVFDGMGGEERGEAASYLAAEILAKSIEEFEPAAAPSQKTSDKEFSTAVFEQDIPLKMNDRVCSYIKEEKLRFCGSTLAMISINANVATCTNVGDSRIYLLRERKLIQVSEDHSVGVFGRKSLTQCLGIPKEEFIISPYNKSIEIKKGDIFIICSDGVTDMISHNMLEQILAEGEGLAKMESLILENGAIDNYTGIVLYF